MKIFKIFILCLVCFCFFTAPAYSAIKSYNRKIESYNDYITRGIRHYLKKEYKEALHEMQKAKARKITPKVFYWMGEIYIGLGDNDQAELCFNKAIVLYISKKLPIDFVYVVINAEKGYLFYLKKDYQMAIRHFEVSLKYAQTDSLKQYYRNAISEIKRTVEREKQK